MKKTKILLLIILSVCYSAYSAYSADSFGQIDVTKVVARETIAGSKVTAVYMDIKNNSDQNISLFSVKTKIAKRAEIHESSQVKCHEGKDTHAVFKMRQLDKLEIVANGSLNLAPGGYHIMLIDLVQPLKQGDKVDLTLVFNEKTEKDVTAVVTSNL